MKRHLAIVSLVVCGAAVATAATNDLMVARQALRDELVQGFPMAPEER